VSKEQHAALQSVLDCKCKLFTILTLTSSRCSYILLLIVNQYWIHISQLNFLWIKKKSWGNKCSIIKFSSTPSIN
jgi:hypothetical protein